MNGISIFQYLSFLQKKLMVNSLNNLKTTLLFPMFVTVNNSKGGMNEVTYKFQIQPEKFQQHSR